MTLTYSYSGFIHHHDMVEATSLYGVKLSIKKLFFILTIWDIHSKYPMLKRQTDHLFSLGVQKEII
jgi:hypothetical protein